MFVCATKAECAAVLVLALSRVSESTVPGSAADRAVVPAAALEGVHVG